MDLNDLFGNARQAIDQGMNDLLKTGGNSALGYLEGQAIQVIQADKSQHDKDAQSATKEFLSRPSEAGSFGEYFGSLIKSPLTQTYGGPLLMVVGGLTLVLVLVLKK